MPDRLATSRLLLGAVEPRDESAVYVACQDRAIQDAIPIPVPYRHEDARFFTTAYVRHGEAAGGYDVWALRHGAWARDDELLGVIELRHDEAAGSGSFGCWLNPRARGRGYAREAVRRVIRHAFSPAGWNLTTVRWDGLVGNEASLRLALDVGFRPVDGTHTVDHRGRDRAAWTARLERPVPAGT